MALRRLPYLFLPSLFLTVFFGISCSDDYQPGELLPRVDWEFGALGGAGNGGAGGEGGHGPAPAHSLEGFQEARDRFFDFMDECETFGDKNFSFRRYPSLPYFSDLFTCILETGVCAEKEEFLCDDYPDEWNDCFKSLQTFECENGDLIAANYRCDTIADCREAEDEKGCQDFWFRCGDGSPVLASQRCDGRPHCPDGSDENDCEISYFACDYAKSIFSWQVCNGKVDCGDGTDEKSNCARASCN